MGFQESSSSEGKKASTYPTRQVEKVKLFLSVYYFILEAINYEFTTQPGKIWKSRHGEAGTGIILPLLLVL